MNKINLLENERIDDLQFNGLKIIQNKDFYCFTCDAVLLANFAKATYKDDILDLCSGSGVVGILTLAKTNAKSLTCIEMQQNMTNMCERTILMNELQSKAKVVNVKVQDAVKVLGNEKYSVIVCNPPYKKVQSHKISEKQEIGVCKYELTLKLDELIKNAEKLLKFGGKFYFCHETDRLTEIIELLNKHHMPAKVLRFVYPKQNANSNIVLIKAVKGAKNGCIVEPAILLND